MGPNGTAILDHLRAVAQERERRRVDPVLDARVRSVKQYQHARFAKSYADMLCDARHARAARFFLDDLYGPHDFVERDDQFARVVPALVRLFPREILGTVGLLAELHALSEVFDTQMALALVDGAVDAATYIGAWRVVGRPADRERQVALMLAVGDALDRYTRNPVLRHTLRLMRGPARAAGMASLQSFLETGFNTFREMHGAAEFLAAIAAHERSLAALLFGADADAVAAGADPALGQLP